MMRCLFHFLLLLFLTGSLEACGADALRLSADGQTGYSIVVAADASAAEKHAADELASYLKQVTGAEFPRVEKAPPGKPCIAVGAHAAQMVDAEIDLKDLGAEGIVIHFAGENLILTGGSGAPRGALYAIYTFLEDFIGVHWWASDATEVPAQRDLQITPREIRYRPVLEYRDPFIKTAFDPEFAVHNRINGLYRDFGDARGGAVSYAYSFVHTFYNLVPPKEHFATHPEWFAQINGKRTAERSQLCLSNPELLAYVKTRVREWLKEYPQASIVSVSQNDFPTPCQCDACRAIDKEEGSPAGLLLRFINAIAEDIAHDFPNVAVDTLAYQYSRKAPLLARPRENVIIRLCSIECSFLQPLDSAANQSFRDDIEAWSKISQRLYIWDYVINFSHYLAPHPNLRVLEPNIRFFVQHGVKGILEQGNNRAHCGEFEELKAWVLARLLWNPQLKADELIDQFLRGYYDKAAPALRAYIDLLHKTAEPTGYFLKIDDELCAPYLTLELLAQSEELLQTALKSVGDDALLKRRVECVQLGPRYTIVSLWPALKREAVLRGASWPFKQTRDELIKEIHRVYTENKIEALFEDWSGDTTPHIDSFCNRYAERSEPARPPGFEKIDARDFLDLQDERATLWNRPAKANWVADEHASDGKAVWMPCTYYGWNFYLPLSAPMASSLGTDSWTVYAVARAKMTGKEGDAFSLGLYDSANKRDVAKKVVHCRDVAGDGYEIYKLGDIKPSTSLYFWASPADNKNNVEAIWIDRFFLVKAAQK
jgi:hypothetical protein